MKRAAIIGGGPAGVCVLRHLSEIPDLYEPVCFERASQTGGLWVYTDNVGLDDDGLPVHTSMYKSLRANFPKEILFYPDFPHKPSEISYLPRENIMQYLQDYARHFDLEKYIKFKTLVQNVKPVTTDSGATQWDVTYQSVMTLGKQDPITDRFDLIFICTGHYEVPYIPKIPGDDIFKGRFAHSHDFRAPKPFTGQRVATLGGSQSGIDISLDLSKTAKQVYFSHRSEPYPSSLPGNVRQMPGIHHLTEHTVVFENGEEHEIDTLLFCTGYLFNLPFLDKACAIKTNGFVIATIYKHMVNVEYPTMLFIGYTKKVITFRLFDTQCQYIVQILKGNLKLPSKQAMVAYMRDYMSQKIKRGIPKTKLHFLHMDQFTYMEDLITEAGLKPLPRILEQIYDHVFQSTANDLQGYKNFKIILDGSGSFSTHLLSTETINSTQHNESKN